MSALLPLADPLAPVDHAARLPWPFAEDQTSFRYTVNVQPARQYLATAAGGWGDTLVDLGGAEYPQIMADRRRILDADPGRARVMPWMVPACWDLLLFYLRDMAASFPTIMTLDEDGERFHWVNTALGTDQHFTLGDLASLPCDPLTFLGREVPDDLLLIREREGEMHLDAGLVTFAAGWSVTFDAGMSIREIHGPVPRLNTEGVTTRGEQFLMMLKSDQAFRRANWTLSASGSRKLDVSLEELPEWGRDIPELIRDRDWGRLQLRIEVEHFVRLPMTGAVTFNIRTHLCSLADIKKVAPWREQLAAIVLELPDDIATYKGFIDYREDAMAWLLDTDSQEGR